MARKSNKITEETPELSTTLEFAKDPTSDCCSESVSHFTSPVCFNSQGLRKGVSYVFDDLGFVDWSAMIEPKYIVPNRFNFERRKQEVPTSIAGLEEKDKLVLLWGFKRVAKLRGFNSITFKPIVATDNLISLECEICWRGNFETDFRDVCFAGCGDAHIGNTFSFAKKYLTAIAENRAFVRAVRNSLDIPILGQDEIGPDNMDIATPETNGKVSPIDFLDAKLKEKGKTFESLKEKIKADDFCDASLWTSTKDVPKEQVLPIIGRYFNK